MYSYRLACSVSEQVPALFFIGYQLLFSCFSVVIAVIFVKICISYSCCLCVCVMYSWTPRTVRWRCWLRRAAASVKTRRRRCSPVARHHTSRLRAPRTRPRHHHHPPTRMVTITTTTTARTTTTNYDPSPSHRTAVVPWTISVLPSVPSETDPRTRRVLGRLQGRPLGRVSHRRRAAVGRAASKTCPIACHRWTDSRAV